MAHMFLSMLLPQSEHLDTKNGIGKGNNRLCLSMKSLPVESMSAKAKKELAKAGITSNTIQVYHISYPKRAVDSFIERKEAKIPSNIKPVVEALRVIQLEVSTFSIKNFFETNSGTCSCANSSSATSSASERSVDRRAASVTKRRGRRRGGDISREDNSSTGVRKAAVQTPPIEMKVFEGDIVNGATQMTESCACTVCSRARGEKLNKKCDYSGRLVVINRSEYCCPYFCAFFLPILFSPS